MLTKLLVYNKTNLSRFLGKQHVQIPTTLMGIVNFQEKKTVYYSTRKTNKNIFLHRNLGIFSELARPSERNVDAHRGVIFGILGGKDKRFLKGHRKNKTKMKCEGK